MCSWRTCKATIKVEWLEHGYGYAVTGPSPLNVLLQINHWQRWFIFESARTSYSTFDSCPAKPHQEPEKTLKNARNLQIHTRKREKQKKWFTYLHFSGLSAARSTAWEVYPWEPFLPNNSHWPMFSKCFDCSYFCCLYVNIWATRPWPAFGRRA